jgi:hypothetical protein
MKHLLALFMLLPVLTWGQESEYLVFETIQVTPAPDKVLQFETLVKAHNNEFHPEGTYGVRVYEIASGPNSGKYNWVMGPATWSALDSRPSGAAHTQDWVGNVVPNLLAKTNVVYWRFRNDKSRFPVDLNISKLYVWQVDVHRDGWEKAMDIMDKVHKVYAEKLPGATYGVYTNELASTSQGNDLAIIWFFDKWAWMAEDNQFAMKYNEVHGEGSFEEMLDSWREATAGVEQELWVYREDLSSNGPLVKAADRQ